MRFSGIHLPVCSPSRYNSICTVGARLKMIRVGMDTKHINHDKQITIPKKLKEINPNYATAHFGKWDENHHYLDMIIMMDKTEIKRVNL